jgi:phosphate transport system protein
MTKHLEREIERLKRMILALSALVEESVFHAIKSVEESDPELARAVIEQDRVIDDAEVEVEEECLKILALHQPVAIDLRFIVAVLKINNELERIADLAGNIASRGKALAGCKRPVAALDFGSMYTKVKTMLHQSLEALVRLDPALARTVCLADREIDDLNKDNFRRLKELMRLEPEDIDALVHYLSVSRNLERIADHATNIAEDIVYMITGDIVRHRMGAAI